MMERILWNGGMVVVGGLLVACATQEGVLRDRVSAELECPPAGVAIVETGPDTFDVSACGEEATYVCTSPDDPGGIVCTRQQEALASAGGETPLAEDADDADGTNDSLEDPEGEQTADASDAAGEDVQTDPAEAPGTEADGATGETGEAPAGGDAEADGADAPRPGPTAVENAVRRAIDERNQVILECVGRDHVVVSAAYRRTGVVRVSLRGELQGSAEERCVAAALRDLRVNTRRTEGVVLHPVHR